MSRSSRHEARLLSVDEADLVARSHHPWLGEADDVGVDPVAGLKIGSGEQVGHQFVGIDAIGARDDDDAARVLVIAEPGSNPG